MISRLEHGEDFSNKGNHGIFRAYSSGGIAFHGAYCGRNENTFIWADRSEQDIFQYLF